MYYVKFIMRYFSFLFYFVALNKENINTILINVVSWLLNLYFSNSAHINILISVASFFLSACEPCTYFILMISSF